MRLTLFPPRFAILVVIALAAIIGAGPARAAYPERPIKLFVGFAPGGAGDITAREFAPFLEKYLGKGASVVVENRPGSDGANMLRELRGARPDGYNLGWFITPHAVAVLHEGKDVRYTIPSFEYLGQLMEDYAALSVSNDSEFKNGQDMIAWAKQNPDKLAVGVSGFSGTYIAVREYFQKAGVKVTFVPFGSGGEMATALLGKHIQAAAINLPTGVAYKDTQRMVVVFSGKPVAGLDVQTAAQTGYPDTAGIGVTARGIVAPAGIPEDAKKALVDAIAKVAADPDYQTSLRKKYNSPSYLAPAEYKAYAESLYKYFGEIWARDPWVQK